MQTQILNLPSRLLRHVLVLILFYLPFLLTITNTSYATVPNNLPTTPDGSTNTRVINAANGVPVVNIAAPDASGISRNNFSDYNVNRIGQVLNNASTDVYGNGAVNTNIAGIVLTNPHLKGSAGANVILNSVTSNRITRINGFTEIAGRKADLIISNPNGIMINSGGFINTDRLSMIVGHEISGSEANNLTGNAVNSSNLYFRLTSAPHLESGFLPSLTISGDGIDLTRVDRTEFAANLIRVNRGVYAGDNKVSFLTGDVLERDKNPGRAGNDGAVSSITPPMSSSTSSDPLPTSSTSPNSNPSATTEDTSQIAIDVSSLSQIQAGNIFMISTKEGFGVRYSGSMIANLGEINIRANGDVDFEDFNSRSNDFTANSNLSEINILNSNIEARREANLTANTNIAINNSDVTSNDSILSARRIDITNNSNIATQNMIANITGDVANDSEINIDQTSKILSTRNADDTYNPITITINDHRTDSETSSRVDLSLISDTNKISFNNDGQIISENTLSIIADGNINLNATSILSSANLMNIESTIGDITNIEGAEIISGSGLTLSAILGSITQNSTNSVVVNGNHSIAAYDYTNTGRIDISGDLTMNITNDLINDEGATIFAGNDMFLNIGNNLTNNEDAAIYAINDLFIRKLDPNDPNYDANNNNVNRIDNIAATIESENNMTIDANVLNNTGIDYDLDERGFFGYNINYLVHRGGYGEGYYNLMNEDQVVSTLRTKRAFITSGNDITINNAAVHNYSSSITAQGDITINNGSLNNETSSILVNELRRQYGKHWTSKSCSGGGLVSWFCSTNHHYHSYESAHSVNAASSEYANIKAGGSFTLNGATQVNNGYLNESLDAQIVQSEYLSIDEILSNGQLDINLDSLFLDPDQINFGLFTKSSNPNSPLFETRSQFVDQSEFFASDYFYNALGVNLEDLNDHLVRTEQRFIGDQFFQAKIIARQMSGLGKENFLPRESLVNDTNLEVKGLIDNAVLEVARLGLDVNETLTQEQIDSLEEDILWYETKQINGNSYLTPKIYLSQATRNKLKDLDGSNKGLTDGSLIFAGNDLNITTSDGGIINSGSIVAGNDGTLIANSALDVNNNPIAASNITNNNFSEIKAKNNLTITANHGSIINRSAIQSDFDASGDGDLTLTAANNIFNLSTVKTNAQNLLDETYSVSGDGDETVSAYVGNGAASQVANHSKFGTTYSDAANITSELIETAAISGNNVTINAGKDFTNVGANVTGTGDVTITAGDDINIETVKLRNRTEERWSFKKKSGVNITDTTTNTGSKIVSGGSLALTTTGLGSDGEAGTQDLDVGSSIIITGSEVTANDDLTLAANNNVIIANAVDTHYSYAQVTKKGSTRKSISTRTDYVERAVSSNLNAKNIDIRANNNILIQGSNTNSNFDSVNDLGGNTTLTANREIIITNAALNEYHHSSRQVSNRGVFKGVTAVTSALTDFATIGINLAIAVSSPITKNIDDPIQQLAESTPLIPDSISDKIDYDYLKNKYKDTVYENQYHNTQIDTRIRHNLTNIVSSNVNVGNDLTLMAANEVTVQGSNLRAGLGEYTSSTNPTSSYDKDKANGSRTSAVNNANITGNLTINSNDLTILSATSYDSRSINKETERINSIRNNITNNITIINTDSTLGAKNDDFTFNVTNSVNVKGNNLGEVTMESQNVNTNNFSKGSYALTTINPPAYLDALRTQLDTDIISETYQSNSYTHTEATIRELTDVGSATIAIAAATAVVLSAGTATPLVTAGTAVASAAAATASVTATQASMNADGGSLKQMKDVTKVTWDNSTSRDSMENYAIAAATAYAVSSLMTATGLQELKEANDTAKAANNAQAAGSGTTGIGGVGTISANNANNALTGWQQVGVSLAESTISNTAAVATQSAISGESFKDASEELIKNIVIGAASNLIAKEIGTTYKDSDKDSLDRTIQLTSHAALGCASGAAAGGDCASGAVAGVVGELSAEFADQSLELNKQQSIEFAGLAGGFSAIFTGNAVGLSDSEVAENIYVGQRVGKNAGENNALNDGIGFSEMEEERILYKETTPSAINKLIEETRGSEQTIYPGKSAVYKSGKEWNGVVDPEANNIGIGNISLEASRIGNEVSLLNLYEDGGIKKVILNEGGLASLGCNYLMPACNDMSLSHDYWASQNKELIIKNPWILQASIPPAYIVNTYGLAGKPINILEHYFESLIPEDKRADYHLINKSIYE